MYFVMYRDTQGYWRWRLNAGNHETLASGEAYVNKSDCARAIQLVKGSTPAPVYEK